MRVLAELRTRLAEKGFVKLKALGSKMNGVNGTALLEHNGDGSGTRADLI